MATSIDTVYVGATRKGIRVTIPDKNSATGAPLNLSGGSVSMLGACESLPSISLNVAGALLDPVNGVAQWTEVGKDGSPWISTSDMGGKGRVQVKLWWKYTDAAGKVDFGPPFYVDWALPGN